MAESTTLLIQSPDPSSWGVILRLCASDSETTRTVGFALRDLVETGLGSVVAGPPSFALLSSLTGSDRVGFVTFAACSVIAALSLLRRRARRR